MAYLEGNIEGVLQGTWTPTITGSVSNPTITYSRQAGRYTRYGDIVFCQADLVMTSYSGGSGNLQISLPFTTAGTQFNIGVCEVSNVTYTGQYVITQCGSGATNTLLVGIADNSTVTTIQVGAVTATARIVIQMQYLAA